MQPESILIQQSIQSSVGPPTMEVPMPVQTHQKPKVINTRVAGVSFANDDGTSRQDIIKGLTMGDRVLLVRDKENEHDFYAVQVQTMDGEVIGWVPRQKSLRIAPQIDHGVLVVGMAASRGKARGKDMVGLNIDIMLFGEEDRRWVEDYLQTDDLKGAQRRERKRIRRQAEAENSGCLPSLLIVCAILFIAASCVLAMVGR